MQLQGQSGLYQDHRILNQGFVLNLKSSEKIQCEWVSERLTNTVCISYRYILLTVQLSAQKFISHTLDTLKTLFKVPVA